MSIILAVVSVLLIASIGLSATLILKLRRTKSAAQTQGEQRLLRDLLSGQALVRIERIAPEDVFLRSPRGRA